MKREKIYYLIPNYCICGNLQRFMAELGLFTLISAILNRIAPVF
jgi:hypothetical protein